MAVVSLATVQVTGDPYALEHWDDPGAPWDRLLLGDDVMPGVWEIDSGECARQVDHKKTKGKDGARIRDQGVLPSRFTARGRMIARTAWRELQRIVPKINPRQKGGLRSPLGIYHPAVALLGVSTIYVERIRAPEIKHNGILEIAIDMIEWTEPKPTKTTTTPKTKGVSPEQFLANSLATPVTQWYGTGINVAVPSEQDNSDVHLDEAQYRQLVSRPSDSRVQPAEFGAPR